jgi:hypothetical protein
VEKTNLKSSRVEDPKKFSEKTIAASPAAIDAAAKGLSLDNRITRLAASER